MTMSTPAVRVTDVSRSYVVNSERVMALRNINLTVEEGAFIALMGRSGSGKTTLLNMIGGLDQPSEGEVALYGTPLNGMNQEKLTLLRREKIGFIFQSFALLPILSAWENVEMPLRIAGVRSGRERRQRSEAALALVGLEKGATHRPAEMSGGQQQRVAIARALVSQPRLLLADEPTGELDFRTGVAILALLRDQAASGRTVLVVTHNREISRTADRVVELSGGRIVSDGPPEGGRAEVADLQW